MLTDDNFAANLRTVTRNARAELGLPDDPTAWTLDQRSAFNRAVAAAILKYPASFSPEQRDIAAKMNTDYGQRGHYFDSALGTTAAAASDVIEKVNPLAPGNLPTVAKWLLVALVTLAAFWLFLRPRPAARV